MPKKPTVKVNIGLFHIMAHMDHHIFDRYMVGMGNIPRYPRCEPWCWYICLQSWVILKANIGKYSMHGAYGIAMENEPFVEHGDFPWFVLLYQRVNGFNQIFWDFIIFKLRKSSDLEDLKDRL